MKDKYKKLATIILRIGAVAMFIEGLCILFGLHVLSQTTQVITCMFLGMLFTFGEVNF